MRILVMLAGAAVSLAGCGPAASDDTAAAAPTAAGPARIPGEWEYVSRVAVQDVRGGPPGLAEQMRTAPPATTRRRCMSKAEAEEDIGTAVQRNQGGCRFERLRNSEGRIAGTARCNRRGMATTGTMRGNFTPTRIDMTIDLAMTLPARGSDPAAAIKLRMTMAGRRIGACPG